MKLSCPPCYRVRTLFQKQISRTFPGLFQDFSRTFPGLFQDFSRTFPGLFQDSDWFFQGSKIHINPFTPKISMLILLTVCHTFQISYLSLTDFHNFPGPVAFFQDFRLRQTLLFTFLWIYPKEYWQIPITIRFLNKAELNKEKINLSM